MTTVARRRVWMSHVDWEDWGSGRRVVGYYAGDEEPHFSYGLVTAGATTPWSWAQLPGLSIALDGYVYGRGPYGGQLSGPSGQWGAWVRRGAWLTSERRPEVQR